MASKASSEGTASRGERAWNLRELVSQSSVGDWGEWSVFETGLFKRKCWPCSVSLASPSFPLPKFNVCPTQLDVTSSFLHRRTISNHRMRTENVLTSLCVTGAILQALLTPTGAPITAMDSSGVEELVNGM